LPDYGTIRSLVCPRRLQEEFDVMFSPLYRSRARAAVTSLAMGLMAACGGSAPENDPADLVLTNGRIVTVDDALPEAEAMAVVGDRIVALGSTDEISSFIGDGTEVLDLDGRLAIPGFIESHGHFLGIGDANLQLRLMETESWDEIVDMVAAAVAEARPGELVRGRGWHQEKWAETPEPNVDGLPMHTGLSAVSPDNPVVLRHASGHATYANARAMEMSGITRDTPDPDGGQIVRDANGDPIGVFRETASRLLEPATDGAAPPDPRRQVELAQEEVLRKGVTSFQDAGSSLATVDVLREMAEAGELDVRLWVMLRGSNEDFARELPSYRMIGVGENHLTVRAIKHSIDGALGPHGAWLLEPYEDLPSSTGLNTTDVALIEETARLAAEHGYQLCVHAIGDRANRETLDIFQRTFEAHPDLTDLRWRIEHAQHLHPDDIPRFAELGVIASMEGVHATSDAPYVLERLGEQRAEEGAYVWQELIRSGAVVTNGTDAPVEDVDPIASYYATVSRRTRDGSVFYPDQRMSRMEALRSYTINGAHAAFEEDLKGSLSVGKLADVTVLSKDILEIPEEEIPTAEVIYTIVGGDVVYRAGS
jgi:predicted amidohydrolase YtcJ